MNTKTRIASYALWFAYVLALLASLSHVAWAFGTVEYPGSEAVGWLAAIAVDLGLAVIAYGVQQRKRLGRSARDLRFGIFVFAGISIFANFLHAISTEVTGAIVWASFSTIDTFTIIKAVVLSAVLPLLVVYLGDIISADDAREAQAAKDKAQAAIDEVEETRKVADKEIRRAEKARMKAQATAEAERKAEAERVASEQAALDSAFKCVGCDRTFPKQQGLAGHLRRYPAHKANANGTGTAESATERSGGDTRR